MSFRGAPRGRGTGANFGGGGGRGGFGGRGGGSFGGEFSSQAFALDEKLIGIIGRGGFQQNSGPPDQVLGEYP
jgi:hypothetical protein